VRKLAIGLLAAAAAISAGITSTAAAKRYSIERIDVDARVLADGRTEVTETLVYGFRGRFRYAFRDIPLAAGQSAEAIEVREGETVYARGAGEEPGTFRVEPRGRGLRVTWHYAARDERRAFTISYLFTGAVRKGSEIAQFYHQFVGADWDRPIGRVTARVHLAEPVAGAELSAWAHGPLWGEVFIEPDGSVQFGVENLPRRTFFEGRVAFPAELVRDAPLDPGTPRLEEIRAEESRWADEANRARAEAREIAGRRRPAVFLSLAIAALGLAASFVLFRAAAWPHRVTPTIAPGERPADRAPAIVARLVHGSLDARALGATIADLARRGHLSIEEDRSERRWYRPGPRYWLRLESNPSDRLEPFEADLLAFLRRVAASGQRIDLGQLASESRRAGESVTRWFGAWKQLVHHAAAEFDPFEPWPRGAIGVNVAIGLVLIASGIALASWSRTPEALVAPAVGGVLVALFSLGFRRRSESGQREYLAWKAWARRIRREQKAGIVPDWSAAAWGSAFPLAIALGVSKEFAGLISRLPEDRAVVYYPWYLGAFGGDGAGGGGLGTALGSFAATLTSAQSSGVGAGGGATGGGGGGSGGGGGGAG